MKIEGDFLGVSNVGQTWDGRGIRSDMTLAMPFSWWREVSSCIDEG